MIVIHCHSVNRSQFAGSPIEVPVPEAPRPERGHNVVVDRLVVDVDETRMEAFAKQRRR